MADNHIEVAMLYALLYVAPIENLVIMYQDAMHFVYRKELHNFPLSQNYTIKRSLLYYLSAFLLYPIARYNLILLCIFIYCTLYISKKWFWMYY